MRNRLEFDNVACRDGCYSGIYTHVSMFFWPRRHNFKDIELKYKFFQNFHNAD